MTFASKLSITVVLVFWVALGTAKAQFVGLSAQYARHNAGQFVSSVSIPTFHPQNPLNMFVSSGLEFSTSGGAELAGLHLKPVQISWFGTEEFFNNTPYTLLLQLEGGYLIDFRRHRSNAWVVAPALYADYKNYFVKMGYDMDVSRGKKSFFVRAGVSLGLGTLKAFANTQIW